MSDFRFRKTTCSCGEVWVKTLPVSAKPKKVICNCGKKLSLKKPERY